MISLIVLFPQVPGHKSVFVNEPKLSDFKQVLVREGITAEFCAGVLICNNVVAVKKVSQVAISIYWGDSPLWHWHGFGTCNLRL